MPKSHDAKPRNRHRREKAAENNVIPALRFYKTERQLRRLRSRALTDAARTMQAAVETFIKTNGLKWRDYERAWTEAKKEGRSVGVVLMAMAANRKGTQLGDQEAAAA